MEVPITIVPRCVSCHNALSHIYDIYAKEYRKRIDQYTKDNKLLHGNIASVDNTSITMGDVLDSLGLYRICCRTHVIGHKNN